MAQLHKPEEGTEVYLQFGSQVCKGIVDRRHQMFIAIKDVEISTDGKEWIESGDIWTAEPPLRFFESFDEVPFSLPEKKKKRYG